MRPNRPSFSDDCGAPRPRISTPPCPVIGGPSPLPALMSTLQDAHVIVGRDSERAVLADFLARAGRPAALLLEGDAGIGKTTLLRDALERAGERRVLVCRPAPAETPLAFGALADLLDGVELGALPAPQRRALEVALRHVDGTADAHAVAAGFLGLLRA